MNRVIINLDALRHNLSVVDGWMQQHGASWTLVTKVLCGHADTLKALHSMGVRSIGESRIGNLRTIREFAPGMESWYLRVPGLAHISEVVELSDVTLNSEADTLHALNKEAGRRGINHRVIIMIELGDLREGLLPGSLVKFYQQIFQLDNLDVLGIGANLGCLAGVVPNIDQFMQLVLYRELLELKFEHKLHVISAGSSATLPIVLDGQLPRTINHFRIGEAVFLGTDLINGGILRGLRDDVFTLQAELTEIKRKSLVPTGETGVSTPFQMEEDLGLKPGQRGYRALVNIGQLDTEISGLTPENSSYQIAGASSDITVLNVGDSPGGLSVGDMVRFRMSYGALVRLMANKYIEVVVEPGLQEYRSVLSDDTRVPISPVVGESGGDAESA
jgi:predicted amino acid racemase